MSIKEAILDHVIKELLTPEIASRIEYQDIDIYLRGLPTVFDNSNICFISDNHDVDLTQKPKIFEEIQKRKPDFIVISGDFTDKNHIKNSLKTIKQLGKIIDPNKIIIVPGNHEYPDQNQEKSIIPDYFRQLRQNGCTLLRNEFLEIKKGGDSIFFVGIDDPFSYSGNLKDSSEETAYLDYIVRDLFAKIPKDKVKILISHRPEAIDIYSQNKADLVYSGHAHGGQIRIFNRGINAPNQRLFPKYTKGLYKKGNTQEMVSPGVSNGVNIPRINNPGIIYFTHLKSTV